MASMGGRDCITLAAGLHPLSEEGWGARRFYLSSVLLAPQPVITADAATGQSLNIVFPLRKKITLVQFSACLELWHGRVELWFILRTGMSSTPILQRLTLVAALVLAGCSSKKTLRRRCGSLKMSKRRSSGCCRRTSAIKRRGATISTPPSALSRSIPAPATSAR